MRPSFWTFLGVGAWVFLSPWILGFSSINLALWSNLLAGALIVVLAVRAFGFPKGE